jgi:hypothetical protein
MGGKAVLHPDHRIGKGFCPDVKQGTQPGIFCGKLVVGFFKFEKAGKISVIGVEFACNPSGGADYARPLVIVVIVYKNEGDDHEDHIKEQKLVPGNECQQVSHFT